MNNNFQEEVAEYELICYAGNSMPRQYRIFRLTESEAHEKNQAYALNRVQKRFVKVKARFN